MAQDLKLFVQIALMAVIGLALSSCAALNMFKGSVQEEGYPPSPPSVQAKQSINQTETQLETHPESQPQSYPKDQDYGALQAKILRLEDKVDTLENQIAGQKKIITAMEYSDPEHLYQKARNLLLENEPDSAGDLFTIFVQRYPEHSLADNALYWLGECHYTKGRYAKAVDTFKHLVKTYPKAEKVPDALLKTGYAYLSLSDVNRASHYLKLVIKKYPFSPAAEKAEEKLSTFN